MRIPNLMMHIFILPIPFLHVQITKGFCIMNTCISRFGICIGDRKYLNEYTPFGSVSLWNVCDQLWCHEIWVRRLSYFAIKVGFIIHWCYEFRQIIQTNPWVHLNNYAVSLMITPRYSSTQLSCWQKTSQTVGRCSQFVHIQLKANTCRHPSSLRLHWFWSGIRI